jgi:hypothetical protein
VSQNFRHTPSPHQNLPVGGYQVHCPIEIGVADGRQSLNLPVSGRWDASDGAGAVETLQPRDPGAAERAVSIVKQDRPG